MRRSSAWIAAATVAIVPALAVAQLDPASLRTYGGRYAVDCADPASPRIEVVADALLVERGTQRLRGANLQVSVAYFGNSEPPKGFMAALVSEARGGLDLTAMLWSDASGAYLKLDGDAKVRSALGTLVDATFRDCDAARSRHVVEQRAAEDVEARRDSALRARNEQGRFGTALRRALGPLARESWLAELARYPESLDRTVQVAGVSYRVGQTCKPRDCFDNNAVVLYAPADGSVFGKSLVALRPAYFGMPPAVVQRELDRLWREAFRQGR